MRIWPICCSQIGAGATALRPGWRPSYLVTLWSKLGSHADASLSHQLDARMVAGRSGETFVTGE